MPVLPSYRNQSIDLLTSFYMRPIPALNRSKRNFSKFIEELSFSIYQYMWSSFIEFIDQATECRDLYCQLSESTTDALPACLKILGTLQEIFAVEKVISIVIGDGLDRLNCLKETRLKTFFLEFSEAFKTALFLNIP